MDASTATSAKASGPAPVSQQRELVRVGVLGGGAFGTALATHVSRIGHTTTVWARDADVVRTINDPAIKENLVYLKGVKLHYRLTASTNLLEVVENADLILLVVPTPYIEEVVGKFAEHLRPEQVIVSCSKGILNKTLETVAEVLLRTTPKTFHTQLAYLSGPSFALEVAKEMPTVLTIASTSEETAARAQTLLSTSRFRCYRTHDVTGVELGGALKNVLAIGCGISDGLEMGYNARTALICRGLMEMTRLAVALGAHPMTMGGLAGMGDLVLTCTGQLSRNRTVGYRLGQGEKLDDILKSMSQVAEGILTSKSALELSRRVNVSCPIIEGIYSILHEGQDPLAVLAERMSRELHVEVDPTLLECFATSGGTR